MKPVMHAARKGLLGRLRPTKYTRSSGGGVPNRRFPDDLLELGAGPRLELAPSSNRARCHLRRKLGHENGVIGGRLGLLPR